MNQVLQIVWNLSGESCESLQKFLLLFTFAKSRVLPNHHKPNPQSEVALICPYLDSCDLDSSATLSPQNDEVGCDLDTSLRINATLK